MRCCQRLAQMWICAYKSQEQRLLDLFDGFCLYKNKDEFVWFWFKSSCTMYQWWTRNYYCLILVTFWLLTTGKHQITAPMLLLPCYTVSYCHMCILRFQFWNSFYFLDELLFDFCYFLADYYCNSPNYFSVIFVLYCQGIIFTVWILGPVF